MSIWYDSSLYGISQWIAVKLGIQCTCSHYKYLGCGWYSRLFVSFFPLVKLLIVSGEFSAVFEQSLVHMYQIQMSSTYSTVWFPSGCIGGFALAWITWGEVNNGSVSTKFHTNQIFHRSSHYKLPGNGKIAHRFNIMNPLEFWWAIMDPIWHHPKWKLTASQSMISWHYQQISKYYNMTVGLNLCLSLLKPVNQI